LFQGINALSEDMTTQIQDWFSDYSRQIFHTIQAKHELPDYVKKAIDDNQLKDARPHDFAVISPQPRLPCHNKAATWLNHAYYLEQLENIDTNQRRRIEQNLSKFASFWGIEDDVKTLVNREADIAVEQNSYDTIIPLRSPEETLVAAEWLVKSAREVTAEEGIETTAKMASSILDQLDNYSLDLADEHKVKLEKLACRKGCNLGVKVAEAIRSLKVKSEDSIELIDKIASEIEAVDGEELQELHMKLAKLVSNACEVDLPQVAVAPVDHGKYYKLANEVTVSESDLDKLSSYDWLVIYDGNDVSIKNRPTSLSKLSAEQSDKLIEILEDTNLD
jgi:hypothetical protein